jgi:CRISPR system Cascade subunit CasE
MILSKLVLNPHSRQVQREIAEPYQMHRTIMRAYPVTLDKEERVLFRLDADRRMGTQTLLVQSQSQPNWSWLADLEESNYLLCTDEPNPWVKRFTPHFKPDQKLIYRLRANPTIKREGKRRALLREEEQWAWLNRKAQKSGFQVLDGRIRKLASIQGTIHKNDSRHTLRLFVVQFDGILRVTDPSLFLDAVRSGVGSGKGLGCGLLSTAPVRV